MVYIKSKMRKRWRLFHATDFQLLMYPCFFICRVLGIFPYKINTSTFEFSRPRYIISTVVVCVFCGLDLLFIYGIITSKIIFGDVKNLKIIAYCTASCFVMIITLVLSGPRMYLLQTLMEISSELSLKSYKKLSRLIHAKDILGNILMITQMCIYFIKNQMFESNYVIVIAIVTIYLSLLQFQILMLYINCVCILKECFKSINDNLVHMQRLMVNDTKSCGSGLIYHVQRNKYSLKKLKTLERRHLVISDTVQKLNIIFNTHLLATIYISLCAITIEMYSYLVYWQDGIFINIDVHFLVALLTSIINYVIKILLLVWACETGKKQTQEIKTTIHDLLNSTNDKELKYELQLFSLQILHRENIFSTKGLTVDAKLVTIIVGKITTYLVILVQFLNMSHSCDKRTATNII